MSRRPPGRYSMRMRSSPVGPSQRHGLRKLGQEENASLLHGPACRVPGPASRSTGQRGVVVSSPIANRTPDVFADVLSFGTNLSGDPTFREVLKRVPRSRLGTSAHQDLPFDMPVEAFLPARELNGSPVHQVMFALQ